MYLIAKSIYHGIDIIYNMQFFSQYERELELLENTWPRKIEPAQARFGIKI